MLYALAFVVALCAPSAPLSPQCTTQPWLELERIPVVPFSFGSPPMAKLGAELFLGVPTSPGARIELHRLDGSIPSHWNFERSFGNAHYPEETFPRYLVADGDVLVASQPEEGAAGPRTGHVFVYERNHGGPGNWGLATSFWAPRVDESSSFGNALALADDRLVVASAPGGRARGTWLYARDQGGPSQWGLVLEISSDGASSLALDGDTLLLGRSQNSSAPGVVQIHRRDQGGANQWGLVKTLTPSDSALGDSFGASVALDGDTALVGAPRSFAGAPGSAYVFERDLGGAEQWGQRRRLVDPGAQVGDRAGSSVALEGGVALVGAPRRGTVSPQPGSALAFERDLGGPDQWGFAAALAPRDPQAYFGERVALRDGLALVGTYAAAFVFGAGSPARADFRNDAGALNPVSLTATPPTVGETFTASVDLTTTGHVFTLLIGFQVPVEIPLPQGPVLLGSGVLGRLSAAGPQARFSLHLPNDLALCGRNLVLQAAHLGGPPFRLSNAMDLTIGTGY